MKIEKILCPVDFSDSSNHALNYAIAFSKAHAASLHLLHVIQPLSYGVGVDGLDVSMSAETAEFHSTFAPWSGRPIPSSDGAIVSRGLWSN